MGPLPSLNKAYAAIVCEERQQKFSQGVEEKSFMEATTFKATVLNQAPKLKQGGNWPKCSHCQKLGHEKHQYYELIGYPPDWKIRRSKHNTQS